MGAWRKTGFNGSDKGAGLSSKVFEFLGVFVGVDWGFQDWLVSGESFIGVWSATLIFHFILN